MYTFFIFNIGKTFLILCPFFFCFCILKSSEDVLASSLKLRTEMENQFQEDRSKESQDSFSWISSDTDTQDQCDASIHSQDLFSLRSTKETTRCLEDTFTRSLEISISRNGGGDSKSKTCICCLSPKFVGDRNLGVI